MIHDTRFQFGGKDMIGFVLFKYHISKNIGNYCEAILGSLFFKIHVFKNSSEQHHFIQDSVPFYNFEKVLGLNRIHEPIKKKMCPPSGT